MISIGKNIRQPGDKLEKITVKQLADKIRNPHQKFVDYITQLRKIITIDVKRYREYKTRLPYAVAAVFNPPVRKIENFAHTSYFILDIDHLSEKELDIEQVFTKFTTDPRIVLMFRSPSNDGIKLFFKTDSKLYDPGKYSIFYKAFAQKFSSEYSLQQVVDKKTSDVSRACFLSYDPDVWYNGDAEPVKVSSIVDFDNQLEVMEVENFLKEANKDLLNLDNSTDTDIGKQDIDGDILREIRERLNPKLKVKREKQIIVPEELDAIIDVAKNSLAEYGFEIEDIVNINYGKQFRMKYKHLKAEVNVFYGKKGFSIVKSTKSGMNKELVEIAHGILESAILGRQ